MQWPEKENPAVLITTGFSKNLKQQDQINNLMM